MRKAVLPILLTASALLAQYKTESSGAPPAELAAAIKDALQKEGTRIAGGNGSVVCEVWLRAKVPAGTAAAEPGVTLGRIPHGVLVGAIRFPADGMDRRGLPVKAGVYTLRYSQYPVNGDHQGIAPQRDFLILLRPADDPGLDATPEFDKLMDPARKAAGGPHPLTLSLWKDEGGASGFTKMGENDWVLHAKIGDLPVAIILVGQYAG